MITELLKWFEASRRPLPWRNNPDFYRVWVSEIMLQQTRIETVIPYYHRFLKAAPDVAALAAMPEEKLLKLWEGLGYYSRVRNMQKAARQIVQAGHFPQNMAELRALPGIGEYTAGAIGSMVLNLPEPAVDGNVLRVLSRFSGHNMEKPEAAAFLKPLFPPGQCGSFTQAWMELGETLCLPQAEPLCILCPLCSECVARREGSAAQLPCKRAKKTRKIEEKTVFLIRFGNKYIVEKRSAKGVLAGLWGFPEMAGFPAETAIRDFWKSRGAKIRALHFLPDSKHIFTHIEWRMKNCLLDLEMPPPGITAAAETEDLLQNYAIPSAYKGLMAFLKGVLVLQE